MTERSGVVADDDAADEVDRPLPRGLGRVAGLCLALSALLLLGYAVAFVVEDPAGSWVLLLLLGVFTLPVLGAALLAAEPAVALARDGRRLPRTPVVAGLLAVGHLGVALIALRPGVDRSLSAGDVLGGALGAVGLVTALVALGLTLPGRLRLLRLVLVLVVGLLLLGLVVARAVAATG